MAISPAVLIMTQAISLGLAFLRRIAAPEFSRGFQPIGIYTSSGFPKSHHRQVVGCSILTYALNNGKRGLGLNHPPPAGGGIPGIFPVPGRLGLNDPPATAGGIWLNIICVDITGTNPWRL